MKRILICLFPLILLSACNDKELPATIKFPDVPQELITACPDLAQLDSGTNKLSDVVSTVSNNYTLYYECKLKVDNWIEWYNTHKSIVDSVK